MINHARTLLLNLDGSYSPGMDYPGEEIIPYEFRSVTLPSAVQSVRANLFGLSQNRAVLNYRARQYLTMLAATELQQYVTDLDPRITYDWRDDLSLVDLTSCVPTFDRPVTDLGQINEAFKRIGEPVLNAVLGVEARQPFITFRNLWWAHPELPYQLGGMVLAVIYRTEEIRSGRSY